MSHCATPGDTLSMARPVGDNAKGPKLTIARPAVKVWFIVNVEVLAE